MAVSGVRRSWETLVTASFSSRSPFSYRWRWRRSSLSWTFSAAASLRAWVSRVGRKMGLLVSESSRSPSWSVMPSRPFWSRRTRINRARARAANPPHSSQGSMESPHFKSFLRNRRMPVPVDRVMTASEYSGNQFRFCVSRLAYSTAWLLGSRA